MKFTIHFGGRQKRKQSAGTENTTFYLPKKDENIMHGNCEQRFLILLN